MGEKQVPFNPRNEREAMDQDLRIMMADLSTLVTVWRETEDRQWQRSAARSTVEDAGITGKGSVSDPTAGAVLDERRQKLREQRVRVSSELSRITATITTLCVALERATEEHG